MLIKPDDLLTIQEFCEFLGFPDLPHATIHSQIRRGPECLTAVKSGRDGGGGTLIRGSEAIRYKGCHKIRRGERHYIILHVGEETKGRAARKKEKEIPQAPLPMPQEEKKSSWVNDMFKEIRSLKGWIGEIFKEIRSLKDQMANLTKEVREHNHPGSTKLGA